MHTRLYCTLAYNARYFITEGEYKRVRIFPTTRLLSLPSRFLLQQAIGSPSKKPESFWHVQLPRATKKPAFLLQLSCTMFPRQHFTVAADSTDERRHDRRRSTKFHSPADFLAERNRSHCRSGPPPRAAGFSAWLHVLDVDQQHRRPLRRRPRVFLPAPRLPTV